MDRLTLDRFTRDIWRRFDHRDLEPLKWAILRRRRALAKQLRPQTRLQPRLDERVIEPGEEHARTLIPCPPV